MSRNKVILVAAGVLALVVGGGFFLATQRDDASAVGQRAAPPPSASAVPAASGAIRFQVDAAGVAQFLIDAPLEKIKGRSSGLRGSLDVDVSNLTRTAGEVDLDLSTLKTETFDDADKNSAQTEHSHNWMEIGADVPADQREQNRWARFTIDAIDSATPSRLADAAEAGGVRTIKVVARGHLWLHGVTSAKTLKLTATFAGPPSAPSSVHIVSDEPLTLSLKEHDIKPRDVGGKFLNGALERVGKKIDDKVQVSLDATAHPAGVLVGGLKP